MAIDQPNLGDKALSKVVEVGIAIGLDEAEVIDAGMLPSRYLSLIR
jgi:hypothetical protein